MAADSVAIIGEVNSIFGAGLRAMLQASMHFSKIQMAASLQDVLRQLDRFQNARLLVLDFAMPGVRDTKRLREIRLQHPSLYLVIVTESLNRSDILFALSAGAHGYVSSNLPFDEIVEAFSLILAGKIYVPREISIISSAEPESELANVAGLSVRERQVMALVAKGHSTKMIAGLLDLSEGTVKVHISASFRKLGVKNRISAAALLGF
jgi:DNA-binding NarL/FixJ family response regulator